MADLDSDNPRVREAGLTSLARQGVTVDEAVIARLSMDPDPGVRREAIQFSATSSRDTLAPAASLMIPTLERVLFLKTAELFSQLPGEELAPMAVLATEEQYAAGTDVLRQGEIGDALYLIVEGRVRMHRRGRVLATLGPHDSFGEMEVLDPAPRFATVTAETDVTLLKLAEADVRDLLQQKHELALSIIQVLTRRLRTANRTQA
jgi:CRP-like cAMP-binding protein